jgi:hypothetical protein
MKKARFTNRDKACKESGEAGLMIPLGGML